MKDKKITITRSFAVSIIGERVGRRQYENVKLFSECSIELDTGSSKKERREISAELNAIVVDEVMKFEAELVDSATQEASIELDKNPTSPPPF